MTLTLRGVATFAAASTLVLGIAACGGSDGTKTGKTVSGTNTTGTTTTTVVTPVAIAQKSFAFVGSLVGGTVGVYDVGTAQLVTSTTTGISNIPQTLISGGRPMDLAIGGTNLYALDIYAKNLAPFSLQSNQFVAGTPISLASAPIAQQTYWYVNMALSFIQSLFSSSTSGFNSVLYWPTGLAAGPIATVATTVQPNMLYVPAAFTTTIVKNGVPISGVIDIDLTGMNSGSFFGLFDLPVNSLGAYHAVAIKDPTNPAADLVFVSNLFSATVSVLKEGTSGWDVYKTVRVGDGPSGIAADRYGNVWVCCLFSGEVYKIDPVNNFQVEPVLAGLGPIDIVCGPLHAYVTNYFSGEITVIDLLSPSSYLPALYPMSISSLVNSTLQPMLTSLVGSLGTSTGGSGSLTQFLSYLMQALGSGSGTGGSSLISSVLTSLLQGMGGTSALPMCGLMGIGYSECAMTAVNGQFTLSTQPRLTVANAVTGEITVIDPANNNILSSGIPIFTNAQWSIPGVTTVQCFDR